MAALRTYCALIYSISLSLYHMKNTVLSLSWVKLHMSVYKNSEPFADRQTEKQAKTERQGYKNLKNNNKQISCERSSYRMREREKKRVSRTAIINTDCTRASRKRERNRKTKKREGRLGSCRSMTSDKLRACCDGVM